MPAGKYANATYDANNPVYVQRMAEMMGIPLDNAPGVTDVNDPQQAEATRAALFPGLSAAQINDKFAKWLTTPVDQTFNGIPYTGAPVYNAGLEAGQASQVKQSGPGGAVSGPFIFTPKNSAFDNFMLSPAPYLMAMGGAMAAGGAFGGAAGGAASGAEGGVIGAADLGDTAAAVSSGGLGAEAAGGASFANDIIENVGNFTTADIPSLSGGAGDIIENAGNFTGGNAAETLGGGPSVTNTVLDAPASNTETLAKGILNSGSPNDIIEQSGNFTGDPATSGAPSKGIIDNALEWMRNNRTASTIGGQLVSGALKGAGEASLAKQRDERLIRGRKQLMAEQTAQNLAQSRGGTYTGGTGIAPSGAKILYRPDGTPVFVNGIINTALRR